jgi:heme-degrading monooxygenase HmoA
LEQKLIARLWHGKTNVDQGDEYEKFLLERAVPDYQSATGLRSLQFLRRDEGGVAHFLLVTFWQSRQAMAAFSGKDIERAKYYPEDDDFLLQKNERVKLYEMFYSCP